MSTKFVQSVPLGSHIKANYTPKYAFLAYPPPKKQPTQPLPSPPSNANKPASLIRRRSNTFSTIAAWAAHVQPGSPASLSPRSPYSPRRRPSFSRSRKLSITSTCVPSGSFLDTPCTTRCSAVTPSVQNFKADLTSVGYTSVFLQLPNTPISTTLSIAVKPRSAEAWKQIPVPHVPASPTRKTRGLNRIRSLSVLKSRGRSRSAAPSSPTKMKSKAAASSAGVVKRKKAKYAALRPAPLANELALMQLVDGGSMESNIKRVMEAQVRAGATGVADVYRDGEGGVWWDQEEEWEYAHLLASGEDGATHGVGDLEWITFGGDKSPPGNLAADNERRGSVSTQDSDLDPRYIVEPTDHLDTDDLAVFGSALAPLTTCKPAMSVLAIPSRPLRAAKHLHKPDFLVNVAFTMDSTSPKSSNFSASTFASSITKAKGNARRRPAPLTLSPPSPTLKRPSNSPVNAERIRRDFFESSFEPAVPATPVVTQQDSRAKLTTRALNLPFQFTNFSSPSFPSKKTLAKKSSRLNMMGLFKTSKKEEVQCTVPLPRILDMDRSI